MKNIEEPVTEAIEGTTELLTQNVKFFTPSNLALAAGAFLVGLGVTLATRRFWDKKTIVGES